MCFLFFPSYLIQDVFIEVWHVAMIGYWTVVVILKVFLQGHGVMGNVQHCVQVVRKDLKKKKKKNATKHNVTFQVRVGFTDIAQAHTGKHTPPASQNSFLLFHRILVSCVA